jgi:LuxR family maltose regulon positive regulatory protein
VVAEANRLLAYAEDPDAAHRFTAVGDELYAMALVTLGTAELWAFQAGEAERHLDQGVALARQIGRPWLEVSGLAHGAWAASFRSIALAAERSTQAIGLAEEHGWSQEPIVGVAYAALGAIRVWQLRLDEAQELLARAERALRAEAEPAAGVVLHQVRGMLELARDRDADALDAFRIAEKLAGLLVKAYPRSTPMRAFLVRALVRLGENDRAGATLAETDGEERATGDMRIALAVLRLAQHNPRAATTALGTVLDGSAQTPQPVWQIEALLLDAIARHALSDPVAGNALERALDLAEPDGVVFPFLLHPAPELLRRHARDGTAHPGLISRVLSLFPGPQEHGGAAALPVADGSPDRIVLSAGALPEPLTGSETRILRYLVTTHLAAPEIARELFVSVNTIRTHMRHIYEKLGVHRRSEAADRARALGLFAHSPRS